MRKYQDDMQKLNKEFEIQMAAVRLQLQRANEIHDQEVPKSVNFQNFSIYFSSFKVNWTLVENQ